MSGGGQGAGPTLRVVSGDATPEEVAAVLAVVAARGRAAATARAEPEGVSLWAARDRGLRTAPAAPAAPAAGGQGWRTSYRPR